MRMLELRSAISKPMFDMVVATTVFPGKYGAGLHIAGSQQQHRITIHHVAHHHR